MHSLSLSPMLGAAESVRLPRRKGTGHPALRYPPEALEVQPENLWQAADEELLLGFRECCWLGGEPPALGCSVRECGQELGVQETKGAADLTQTSTDPAA